MNREEIEFIGKIAIDNVSYNVDSIGYPSRIMLRKDIGTMLDIIENLQSQLDKANNKIKEVQAKLEQTIKENTIDDGSIGCGLNQYHFNEKGQVAYELLSIINKGDEKEC